MSHSTSNIQHLTLPIMESFYTLQGEGFHQGRAAYFIRLGGCDVGCVWCDVKDSWDADKHPKQSVEEIVGKAIASCRLQVASNQKLETGNRLLTVITGGEPLLHSLDELTHQLHEAGFETNIETSGSSPLSGKWDWICLSPKKFKPPLPEILLLANELKVVIYHKQDFDWAEEYASKVSSTCKLYLQPEWDKKESVTPLIIEYIKQNPKWELSLQIHKFINVP